jgi:putative phosphoesterase
LKALFFTDVHGSTEARDWVVRAAPDYDAVIVGGDLTRGGQVGFSEKFLRDLATVAPNTVFVHGNADPPTMTIPASVTALHGKTIGLGDTLLGGLGGSNITPFGTPFELEDVQTEKILNKMGKVQLLVSHCPPFNTKCDTTAADEHLGSKTVRAYVENHSPAVVLSGHVHEARSTDTIGKTLVANPGPLMFGNYAVVELGPSPRVALKQEAF